MDSAAKKSRMRWRLAERPSADFLRQFEELPEVAASLLWNRGLTAKEEIDRFLDPQYDRDIHDPFLFRDMRPACELVLKTLKEDRPLVVYSDYDADGVTGASVLLTVFREAAAMLGKDSKQAVKSYIPHREKEGYGLRLPAVEKLLSQGMKLMVSVDCGIGSAAEIAAAKKGGSEVIVVDHHQPPEELPDCLTLHPSVPGEDYPFKRLAAVGVAYKFACGFRAHCREQGMGFPEGQEKWLLDLVAIATVTDVVPLIGENRVLEKYGLIVLNKTRRLGLKFLSREAGLEPGEITTESVGFGLGPRINAASRMDHASVALDCMMAEDSGQAMNLAHRLNQINRDRQQVTESMTVAAKAKVAADPDRCIHMIAGKDWPAGVVGIIAGRIANKTGRPCFVFSQEGDRYVGSGRSIPEFNVMEALDRNSQWLARYGGHPQACGLTIEGNDNYRQFLAGMDEYARKVLEGEDLRPALNLEADIKSSQVSWETIEWLSKMEPFGEGNPKPRFLISDVEVMSHNACGKEFKHIRLALRGDDSRYLKTIGFGLAEAAQEFPVGSRIDVAVELGVNEWQGRKEVQARLIDIRPAMPKDSAEETVESDQKVTAKG